MFSDEPRKLSISSSTCCDSHLLSRQNADKAGYHVANKGINPFAVAQTLSSTSAQLHEQLEKALETRG